MAGQRYADPILVIMAELRSVVEDEQENVSKLQKKIELLMQENSSLNQEIHDLNTERDQLRLDVQRLSEELFKDTINAKSN